MPYVDICQRITLSVIFLLLAKEIARVSGKVQTALPTFRKVLIIKNPVKKSLHNIIIIDDSVCCFIAQ